MNKKTAVLLVALLLLIALIVMGPHVTSFDDKWFFRH